MTTWFVIGLYTVDEDFRFSLCLQFQLSDMQLFNSCAARESCNMGISCWNVLGFVGYLLRLVEVLSTDHRFACEASAKICKGST